MSIAAATFLRASTLRSEIGSPAPPATRSSEDEAILSNAALRKSVRKFAPASYISGVIVPFASIMPSVSTARWCTTVAPVSGSVSKLGGPNSPC
jgi:hypothetical protein